MTRPIIQKNKFKCYGQRKTEIIQSLYLLALVLWIWLCVALKMYLTDWFGQVLLLLPIFVFGISFINSNYLTVEIEEEMFKYDYLTIGLLLAFPLLSWMSKDYGGDRKQFIKIIVVAIGFTLLTILDVWIRRKWVSYVKHFKSILQTGAVCLLIYALYNYYIKKNTDYFHSNE